MTSHCKLSVDTKCLLCPSFAFPEERIGLVQLRSGDYCLVQSVETGLRVVTIHFIAQTNVYGFQGLIHVGSEEFLREGGHRWGAGTLSKMAKCQFNR